MSLEKRRNAEDDEAYSEKSHESYGALYHWQDQGVFCHRRVWAWEQIRQPGRWLMMWEPRIIWGSLLYALILLLLSLSHVSLDLDIVLTTAQSLHPLSLWSLEEKHRMRSVSLQPPPPPPPPVSIPRSIIAAHGKERKDQRAAERIEWIEIIDGSLTLWHSLFITIPHLI